MSKSRKIGSVRKNKDNLILVLNPGTELIIDGEKVQPSAEYGTTLLSLFDAKVSATKLFEKGYKTQEEYDAELDKIQTKNISKNVVLFQD